MLQHEQCQQISNDKNMIMHHNLSSNQMQYKQNTSSNNFMKSKSSNSKTTILDSSRTQQQQHHHHHHQQHCSNDPTMQSKNSHSTSLPPTPSPSPTSPTPNSVDGEASSGGYGSSGSAATTIGVNLRVTGQCSQGGRKYMEDYFSVAYQQSENAKDLEYAFIGIYDGHGGAEAATFAKEHLMMHIINQKSFWSDSDYDVLRAIREGYIATHYAMWRDQENWPKTANGLLSTAGTTATVAFIRREKIYIGHVGDSGIVLGYQNDGEKFWRAKQLTVDHKPESAEERARIQRSGGKVVVKSGVPRVVWNRPRNAGHRGPIRCNTPVDEVPFLAVARSLGDLWSYNSMRNVFVVSPDPDVQVIKINPKTFKCLIFGTDGLWNVVTPQEAVDSVYERECINERLQAYASAEGANMEWTNPSKGLVERALKTWSTKKMRADNTSVVTVILYPPTSEAAAANSNHAEICNTPLPYNNSLPNGSCGLEYSELCTEMPTSDCYGDAISYEEIAEKYAMPEAFRDFDYYLDEELIHAQLQQAEQQQHLHHEVNCETSKYCNGSDLTYWNNWNSWEERQRACASGDYNQYHNTSTSSDVSICNEAISHDVCDAAAIHNCESVIAGVGDENAVDGTPTYYQNSTSANKSHNPNSTNSNKSTTGDLNTELGAGNASFMTFAESYNSFLNEQMSHDSTSSSNSNSNCQVISGTNEILQEQQLYQQQCMSEEEGYSLTKLETRREQQRCSGGVQTFKIFQTHDTSGTNYVPQRQSNNNQIKQTVDELEQTSKNHSASPPPPPTAVMPQLTIEEARELEEALTWEPSCSAPLGAISHFIDYTETDQHQQPLELNSLLQQEREEEQRVAYERRLEMQRQLAHAAIAATVDPGAEFKCNDETVPSTMTTKDDAEEEEETMVEEYIEESVEQQEATAYDKDISVQINEISSSMCEHTETSTKESGVQVIEKLEKVEILQPKIETPKTARLGRHPLLPHKSTPLSHYRKSSRGTTSSALTGSGNNGVNNSVTISTATTEASMKEKPKLATLELSNRPPKACPGRTALKRSQTLFPNIPNENARCSESRSLTSPPHVLNKRRRYDGYSDYLTNAVSSTSSSKSDSNQITKPKANPNSGSSNTIHTNYRNNRRCNNAMMSHSSSSNSGNTTCSSVSSYEKRQLRSNSGSIDYSKRTLRTRNSLTKDMKSKSSLTTTVRRVTSQFLHETAVSLMASNSALAQQREQCNSRTAAAVNRNNGSSVSKNTNVLGSVTGLVGSRRARTNADNLEAAFSHVINLRSRKVAQLAVAAAAAAAAVTRRSKGSIGMGGGGSPLISSSTTLMRRERHNLRSLNTRQATSAGHMCGAGNMQREFVGNNYGKTTRSGGGGVICSHSLAASARTTPNGKLLNREAGGGTITRPRAHAHDHALHVMSKQSVGGSGGDGRANFGSVTLSPNSMVMRGGSAPTLMIQSTPPTSYGKRTTALRSGSGSAGITTAAATMMLTRSGRNGKRLNR